MNTKEFRKRIRNCNTPEELKALCMEVRDAGYNLAATSNWGYMEIADFDIFDDNSILMRFPLMGFRRFKDFKTFSYNISIRSKQTYGSGNWNCFIEDDYK